MPILTCLKPFAAGNRSLNLPSAVLEEAFDLCFALTTVALPPFPGQSN